MSGYFAEDSMIVRVMSKRAVGYTYGLRALVVGAVHPKLYVGTAANTEHRDTPYTRLAITGRLFEAVFMGSRNEADRALAFTKRKHARVDGVLPEAAGPANPAGSRYRASDPHLMFMTMAFTFDSAEHMHDVLVRRLSADEREALWQDYIRWAELFGMPRDAAPASYPEFRDYFDRYLRSDEPFLTDEAKLVGTYLAGAKKPGFPIGPKFASDELGHIVRGALPAHIREMYALRWSLRDELRYRAITAGVRAAHVRPLAPLPLDLRPVLTGRSAVGYKQVAECERAALRRGYRSMPEVPVESPYPPRDRSA